MPPQYPPQAPQQQFQPTPQQAFGTPPVQNAPLAHAEPEDDLPF